MSNIVDTGVIQGPDILHFQQVAERMNARMAGLVLMEPGKGAWGASPKEFMEHVGEQLTVLAEGFEGQMLGPNGLEPHRMDGHPDIIEAAKQGTLRLLVGVAERDGCRKVACVILRPGAGHAAPGRNAAPKGASGRAVLSTGLAVVGVLGASWIWTRPMTGGVKIALVAAVLLVFSALGTWVSTARGGAR